VRLPFITVGLYAGGDQGCQLTGLMLVLLYGREGWFSPVLRAAGFNVVFAFPGISPYLSSVQVHGRNCLRTWQAPILIPQMYNARLLQCCSVSNTKHRGR